MAKENNENPTELGQFGEFGLINHLTNNFKLKNRSSVLGIGDDAAVLRYKSSDSLISTDLLVEGVHFDLLYTPLKHLGYKCVVVNLSDIYAMNGRPEQITVSLALSNRISVEALEDLYEGIQLACETYDVDLVGGDTTASTAGLVISITAIGSVKEGKAVSRKGAKENDLICVSGDLGAAYIGLQLLEREKKIYNENPKIQPDFEGYDYLLERQLRPEARKAVVEMLSEKKITPTSMIDISDGLSSELIHICNQSEVGCNVYEEKIPIDYLTEKAANELGIVPTVAALNGGEDYELLFTIPPKDYEAVKSLEWISIIGHITSSGSGKFLISRDDKAIELKAQGWDPVSN